MVVKIEVEAFLNLQQKEKNESIKEKNQKIIKASIVNIASIANILSNA